MNETEPILINVLGAGRAGTTMLGLMLAGSRGFACGEARVWFRPWRPWHLHPSCWCGEDPCPVWEEIGGFPAEDFHRRVVDTLGAEVVTDSSKWLDWARDSADWAREREMRVANVVIWKHPYDLAYSLWKRDRLNHPEEPRPFGEPLANRAMTELAHRFVDYHRRLLKGEPEPVALSYDRLVEEPVGTLTALGEAIGVPYEEGQERFWETRRHVTFGSKVAAKTMRASEPALVADKPSEEFREAAAEYSRRLEEDEEIAEVLERLRGASVS